jgi:hypothetical protein
MTHAIGHRTTRAAALAAAAALVVSLAFLAPRASAAYDPVGSGATVLTLDKKFSKLLKQNGVKLVGLKPGKLKGKGVSIPLSGGKLDPTTAEGTINHDGGFGFKAGGKTVLVKSLILKTTEKHSPLSAKVAGGQLKLGTAAGKLALKRNGFTNTIEVKKLKLSSKFASRLNKRLKLKDVFKTGQVLGSTKTTESPSTTAVLASGAYQLEVNPSITDRLNKLSVPINPIFPAEHSGSGFSMPVIGGTVAPTAAGGEVRGGGSLEMLQIGGGQLVWHELWVNLEGNAVSAEVEFGPSPPHPGKEGRVPLFDLTGGQRSADAASRAVTVSAATLALRASTAKQMNEAFAKGEEQFKAGEAFATLSFTATGQ